MRSRALFLFVVFLTPALGRGPRAVAQTAPDSPAPGYKVRYLHVKKSPSLPFPPGSEAPGPVRPIVFRSPGQMTEADREVEADGEASIRERVRYTGLEFNQGIWSYQQIVCPVFPNHVLLRFTRNQGKGDESVFTASIPRLGQGHVRIIPILRRGYSLFSPAPINALTLSAFNHIRAEEHPQGPPDWLETGMCYAALAGARPQVDPAPADPDARQISSGVPAALDIPVKGGAVIRFLDVAARPKPMEWTMTFSPRGKLLKATRIPAPSLATRLLPAGVSVRKVVPIPATVLDVSVPARP